MTPCRRLGLVLAAVALCVLRDEYVIPGPLPDLEYQAFLDHYPIAEYFLDAPHSNPSAFGTPRAHRPPRLLSLFDWQIRVRGMPEHPEMLDERRGDDPLTVLSGVDAVLDVIDSASSWATARSDRVLVLMGMSGLTWAAIGETEKARHAVVADLGRLFRRVYTVGNNAPIGFQTMPLGLTEANVRRCGADAATAAIAAARLEGSAKPLPLLAAFGLFSKSEDFWKGPLKSMNVARIVNTTSAILFYSEMPFYNSLSMTIGRRSHISGQVPKVVSRQMALKWLKSTAAASTGVVVKSIHPRAWWAEVSKFRFLISPQGDEIQSSKDVEALLVLTIPITQRGPYRVASDLQKLGFPIVAVDEWDEVTSESLARWWRELSPRLLSFRANCLTTEGYWRIITGAIDFCQ